jgi:hypothetical protein
MNKFLFNYFGKPEIYCKFHVPKIFTIIEKNMAQQFAVENLRHVKFAIYFRFPKIGNTLLLNKLLVAKAQ